MDKKKRKRIVCSDDEGQVDVPKVNSDSDDDDVPLTTLFPAREKNKSEGSKETEVSTTATKREINENKTKETKATKKETKDKPREKKRRKEEREAEESESEGIEIEEDDYEDESEENERSEESEYEDEDSGDAKISEGQKRRRFRTIGAQKRLLIFKTLLRIDDVVVAESECKYLGNGEFVVWRISSSGILLRGPNPKKKPPMINYRLAWKRLIPLAESGGWSVSRRTKTSNRNTLGDPVISGDMFLPDYAMNSKEFYEHILMKFILSPRPLQLQKEKKDELYLKALSTVTRDEANFRNFGKTCLYKLFDLYESIYFPGLKNLLKQRRGCKLHFEANSRLTSIAGRCIDRRETEERDVLIQISHPVIMGLKFPMTTRINGVLCENRLQVLLSVFEHELIHALLEIFCPASMWGHSGGHTLAFQHFVKTLFGHTHYRHELLVGDIKQHDQKVKTAAKSSKKLKTRFKVGSILYLIHQKKQLTQWSFKARALTGWQGETYQILKLNPKRMIVLYTKDAKNNPTPKFSIDRLESMAEQQNCKYERYTIPYTYLVGKEVT